MRASVALRAFWALLAAFRGLVRRPRATAAGSFAISVASIPRKLGVDNPATVR